MAATATFVGDPEEPCESAGTGVVVGTGSAGSVGAGGTEGGVPDDPAGFGDDEPVEVPTGDGVIAAG